MCLLNRTEDMAGKTWVFSFPSPSILDNILCPPGVQQLTPNKCPRNGRHSSVADLEVLWLWKSPEMTLASTGQNSRRDIQTHKSDQQLLSQSLLLWSKAASVAGSQIDPLWGRAQGSCFGSPHPTVYISNIETSPLKKWAGRDRGVVYLSLKCSLLFSRSSPFVLDSKSVFYRWGSFSCYSSC